MLPIQVFSDDNWSTYIDRTKAVNVWNPDTFEQIEEYYYVSSNHYKGTFDHYNTDELK